MEAGLLMATQDGQALWERQDKPGARARSGPTGSVAHLRGALLQWYDEAARAMAWRISPQDLRAGIKPDPYHVWLSEVMLQQTSVATVGDYFDRFLLAFPDVNALAEAPLDDVLRLWSGLGYYSRAHNLHAAAKLLAAAGHFPHTEAGWKVLPGIGDYAAASIAAIAFDQPANVIDGNVERVISRLFAIEIPLPKGRRQVREAAASLIRNERPGDYAQALMELGALVCKPRKPDCPNCPLSDFCLAKAKGIAEELPVKSKKRAKQALFAKAYVVRFGDHVLLTTRPQGGLLGGLDGPLQTEWLKAPPPDAPPVDGHWQEAGQVRHIFTHIQLDVVVYQVHLGEKPAAQNGRWVAIAALSDWPLSTLARKILQRAGVEC
jgi:A/G-specific adenine glycosylase